jgi:putative ABC transport system permease protein
MYSSIKIGGFALGIAASLLITLYILDELSFDSQASQSHRIYRVYQRYDDVEKMRKWVWFQAPFAKTIKQDFPEIEKAGRYNNSELFGAGNGQIRRDDQPDNTYEEGITYMDQELLELLEVPMVYGDVLHCLDEPNEIVLTRKKADKYFPNENPVGKLLVLNNGVNVPLKIGGVIEDWPTNSHIQFDFMIGMAEREMWPGEQNYLIPVVDPCAAK